MPNSESNLPQFNPETMAGVFPGARTQVFQRLRARRTPGEALDWCLLLWFVDPVAFILFLYDLDSGRAAGAPCLTLSALHVTELHERLIQAAAGMNLEIRTCGGCSWWAHTAWIAPDGLAVGECRWSSGGQPPLELASQASLALACRHWTKRGPVHHGTGQTGENAPDSKPLPPMVKSAELDPDRLPPLRRWRRRWQALLGRKRPNAARESAIRERSGVGAGTEPCLVCHGRIANLGALVVESPEGDKETLSVWRCRTCYTTYLNDWIDRWERLDNLETEETYYRIAPADAHQILSIITGIPGAEHPAGRGQRHHQRDQVLEFVRELSPLSRQLKQGR